MPIGIGITTRNRSIILDITLQHFLEYTPNINNYKFFVYNDTDNQEEKEKYYPVIEKYNFVNIEYGDNRLGIAKSKNKCLKFLHDCEYVFLFDDDCFPKKIGWDQYYIDTYKKTDIHHLMHLSPVLGVSRQCDSITEFKNCMGVMLFFTRHALDILGGYDTRFNIYGYEHCQITNRAYDAKLMGNYWKYCSPNRSEEFIYSMDIELNNYGIAPPLNDMKNIHFNSSLIGDEGKVQNFIDYNMKYLNQYNIYYKI